MISLLVSQPSEIAVNAGSMSRVRRFRSLVSFDSKWSIASYNLSTWASSSCVSHQFSCSLALLEFTHSFLVSPHVLSGGGKPMAASPFNSFITRFYAILLVHMKSDQRWRLNLKCSTATRVIRKSFAFESLVDDIVEFSSLQVGAGAHRIREPTSHKFSTFIRSG